MAGSNRLQRLNHQGVELLALIFVSFCIPLSMLLIPALIVGAEFEISGEEVELCEEYLSTPGHKRVRDQREQHIRFSWKSWNPVSCCSVRIAQDCPLSGHRLKHDLLAPLTC